MRGRKRKDGTIYPTYYSYACRKKVSEKETGHVCEFGQAACTQIDTQVRDILLKLTNEETFGNMITEAIPEFIYENNYQEDYFKGLSKE